MVSITQHWQARGSTEDVLFTAKVIEDVPLQFTMSPSCVIPITEVGPLTKIDDLIY